MNPPSPRHHLLLQAAFLDGPEAVAAWEAVKDQPLDAFTKRITPRVHRNLLRQGIREPHLWVAARSTAEFNRRRLGVLDDAIPALAKRAIPTLLLKGAALYYGGHAGLDERGIGDADVLVPRARARDAVEVLVGLGWRPPSQRLEEFFENRVSGAFRTSDGREFDLHLHALAGYPFDSADARMWQGSEEVTVAGAMTHVPCAGSVLLHSVAHALRDAFLGPWALDGLLVLKGGARVDWDRLCADAAALEFSGHMGDILEYLRTSFDAPVPATVLQKLQQLPKTRPERFERWVRDHVRSRPIGGLVRTWLSYSRKASAESRRASPVGFGRYLAREVRIRREKYASHETEGSR